MWDAISAVMNSFNDFLWGWFMIILLLGTHIFLTIRTKFVQRKTFKAIKLSVTKDPDQPVSGSCNSTCLNNRHG